jgi:hypothetical protein
MIAAFIAATVGLSSAVVVPGCEHCHAHPESATEHLVAYAWQQSQDEKDPRHVADLQSDRELGERFSKQVEQREKLSTNQEMVERVQKLGAEIAGIANQTPVEALWGDKRLNPFQYQFKVLEGKDVNAFSLPGGFIYVYEGLVKFAESDDELAGVLAHEVAHASLRHVATLRREQQRVQAIQLPAILAAILLGGDAGAVMGAGNLIGTAVGSGWSVKAEQAADYAGFQYMRVTRFNPTGLLTFMERLAVEERNRPRIDWGIFRTHPPSRARAEALTGYMLSAGIPIRRSLVSSSLRVTMEPGENGAVVLRFGARPLISLVGETALSRADDYVPKLNALFDGGAELYEIQAGNDGWILARRRPIMQLNREDAMAANTDLQTLKQQTVRNLRSALFTIGFRVWDGA